jgi:hypothetical protein
VTSFRKMIHILENKFGDNLVWSMLPRGNILVEADRFAGAMAIPFKVFLAGDLSSLTDAKYFKWKQNTEVKPCIPVNLLSIFSSLFIIL